MSTYFQVAPEQRIFGHDRYPQLFPRMGRGRASATGDRHVMTEDLPFYEQKNKFCINPLGTERLRAPSWRPGVIPGPAEGRSPESLLLIFHAWIPDCRFRGFRNDAERVQQDLSA